ncbi:hypothetical protein, partial [Gluconobacter kanchanaburiensis]
MLGVFHDEMIGPQRGQRLGKKRQQFPAFVVFDVDFQNMHGHQAERDTAKAEALLNATVNEREEEPVVSTETPKVES